MILIRLHPTIVYSPIVRVAGYHNLEQISDLKPTIYTTQLPFPTSSLKVESEGVLLEYANSCGLLGKVTGTPNLIQTFRGRRTTPKFRFDVNKSLLISLLILLAIYTSTL